MSIASRRRGGKKKGLYVAPSAGGKKRKPVKPAKRQYKKVKAVKKSKEGPAAYTNLPSYHERRGL